jgi:nicotinate-nucleotide adenylyltransferase
VLLRNSFGITDGEVLAAVRNHTQGREGMGPLEKIVYIADKIEPTRKNAPARKGASAYESPEEIIRKGGSLDSLFYAVLKDTAAYLRSRRIDISGDTKKLLAAMETGTTHGGGAS